MGARRLYEDLARTLAKLGLGRVTTLSRLHESLSRGLKREKLVWTSFEEFEILVDENDFVGSKVKEGNYETQLRRCIEAEVEESDRVAGVGCHVGSIALCFRRNVGSDGEVVCFEPNPWAVDKLEKTIRRNGLSNMQIRDCALSNSSRDAMLSVDPRNTGGSEIKNDGTRKIEIRNANEEIECQYLDWIKLDIEGAESEVVEALGERLTKLEGLFLKVHPPKMQKERLRSMYELLQDLASEIESYSGEPVNRYEEFRSTSDGEGGFLVKFGA